MKLSDLDKVNTIRIERDNLLGAIKIISERESEKQNIKWDNYERQMSWCSVDRRRLIAFLQDELYKLEESLEACGVVVEIDAT